VFELNAGEMPLMLTVDGVPETNGAEPKTTWVAGVAVAEQVEVVPQACTKGCFVTTMVATGVVEATDRGAVPVASVLEICPEAESVVNAPVEGVVPPIGPAEGTLVAVREVNAPVDGVVEPMVPGAAQEKPNRVVALAGKFDCCAHSQTATKTTPQTTSARFMPASLS